MGQRPLAGPHLEGLAVPDGEATRSDDHQDQDTGRDPNSQARTTRGHNDAHASHHGWSTTRLSTRADPSKRGKPSIRFCRKVRARAVPIPNQVAMELAEVWSSTANSRVMSAAESETGFSRIRNPRS